MTITELIEKHVDSNPDSLQEEHLREFAIELLESIRNAPTSEVITGPEKHIQARRFFDRDAVIDKALEELRK